MLLVAPSTSLKASENDPEKKEEPPKDLEIAPKGNENVIKKVGDNNKPIPVLNQNLQKVNEEIVVKKNRIEELEVTVEKIQQSIKNVSTKQEMNNQIKKSIKNLPTKEEMNNQIQQSNQSLVKTVDLPGLIKNQLNQNIVTKENFDDMVNTKNLLRNDSNSHDFIKNIIKYEENQKSFFSRYPLSSMVVLYLLIEFLKSFYKKYDKNKKKNLEAIIEEEEL